MELGQKGNTAGEKINKHLLCKVNTGKPSGLWQHNMAI